MLHASEARCILQALHVLIIQPVGNMLNTGSHLQQRALLSCAGVPLQGLVGA